MKDDFKNIVSTDWLEQHLGAPDIRIIDSSWYFPQEKRNAEQEFLECHIPGASFFDIDKIKDNDSDLPHMLPPPEMFNSTVRKLGIGDGHKVVIYDGLGMRSAARLWWMFKVFGHSDVVVLDGGFPKWVKENRSTTADITEKEIRHLTIYEDKSIVADRDDVLRATKLNHCSIIDARSEGRFLGKEPEPRSGLRSGSIENSINVPYETLLNKDFTFKKKQEILDIFSQKGLVFNNYIITTCGSGVTAAVLYLALDEIGCSKISLYDGSWAEWGKID
ncbi:3-mercaptopyruvate sulfurtransferase [Paracoccaceae bacterium]|nr:3-mercaptopyruvate sulfurtransferase [Paracoccaceae bacterium]